MSTTSISGLGLYVRFSSLSTGVPGNFNSTEACSEGERGERGGKKERGMRETIGVQRMEQKTHHIP